MISQTAIIGSLLGTTAADALGLPYEGLSRFRLERLGSLDRHRFVFGRGMISDDTEHACIVAQSLTAGLEETGFAREMAKRLRWWVLGLPAGAGRASLLSAARLCLGWPPSRSGVYSAGNGPAMRAPILGAAIEDRSAMKRLTIVSSRISHTDPKAEKGALAAALAARLACEERQVTGEHYLQQLRETLDDGDDLVELIEGVAASVAEGESTGDLAQRTGRERGVFGYIYDTMPIVIHAWLSHPADYRSAVLGAIACGGDTDTTAAIVGGIVGAAVGKEGIPDAWLRGVWEWPRSVSWIERLGETLYESLSSGKPAKAPRLSASGLAARNLLFLVMVLAHGFWRLRPTGWEKKSAG